MRLFEHPDFEQAILGATDHFREQGLRPAIIEKDYYVTEALRIVSLTAGDKVIFKGGTSLSKGWNLIQRFSEDIDLIVDKEALGFGGDAAPDKAPSNKKRKERLEKLMEACRQWVTGRPATGPRNPSPGHPR